MVAVNPVLSRQYTAVQRNPGNSVGKKLRSVWADYTIAAASSNAGDVYQVAGPFTMADKVSAVKGIWGALTSATSNDLGFWRLNKTTGVFSPFQSGSDTVLLSAVDLHTAGNSIDMLRTLNASFDPTKNIGDLLSLGVDSEDVEGIYVCLRTNNASTATSANLSLCVEYEEATTK